MKFLHIKKNKPREGLEPAIRKDNTLQKNCRKDWSLRFGEMGVPPCSNFSIKEKVMAIKNTRERVTTCSGGYTIFFLPSLLRARVIMP